MSLYDNLEDIKKDLAQYMNIRTNENTKYRIEVVVGESGFMSGSRDVVKKIIREIHELNRDDILLLQIDDTNYKEEHTVVLVHNGTNDFKIYKNINTENVKTIFEDLI